ncbi:MAG: hypothetical protein WBR26_10500 [Candidatus Acidiferrum sp.]
MKKLSGFVMIGALITLSSLPWLLSDGRGAFTSVKDSVEKIDRCVRNFNRHAKASVWTI